MKKRTILCLSVAAALLLAACTPAEELPSAAPSEGVESTADADTRRPTIRIAASEVIIGKGDDFDLLDGVVGSDDVDGDITDRIEIDKGDYDPGVAGKYTITYNLTDSAGNAAVPKQRIINVRETDVMEKPPIWNDAIEGEKRNPQDPAVYGGAWYHKVVSSKDKWVGIEATVTLPEFKIERYEGEYDASLPVDPAATHLDNPSVYLGGNAQSESDVGLSLSRVLVDVEKQTLSVGGIAFRPFWRYITAEEQDVGGYEAHDGEYSVSANGNNCFANYHWRYTEYYYLPGDTLRMIVYSPEPDKLQLMIEVIEASTLPSSVAMREAYGWKQPANFISPIFRSPAWTRSSSASTPSIRRPTKGKRRSPPTPKSKARFGTKPTCTATSTARCTGSRWTKAAAVQPARPKRSTSPSPMTAWTAASAAKSLPSTRDMRTNKEISHAAPLHPTIDTEA